MKGLLDIVQRHTETIPRPLLVVSAAVALSLLGDQMLYAVLPAVHEAVGVPVTSVGLLLSANRFVRLLTNSLAGYVIGRTGRQWPFVLALLLGGLTTVAYGVVYGVWAFLGARLLWGTAWSFIRLEGLSTALDVASDETRGQYMGFFQALSRLGSAVATFAGGLLADLIGFRATFILFGGLSCLAALPVYAEMASRGAGTPVPIPPRATPTPPSPARKPTDWRAHWRMGVTSFGTFSTFLVIGGLVSATLGYMLRTRFGPTPTLGSLHLGIASLTGLLLSSRGFLDLGFAPVVGYLADRWGRQRMIFWAMPSAVLTVASLALLPALPVVIGLMLCIFAAGTTLNVTFNAVAGDIAPAGQRGTFLSFFVTCQDLGAAVGPLLGYWMGPAIGLVWLYGGGATILLLANLLYVITFTRRRYTTALCLLP